MASRFSMSIFQILLVISLIYNAEALVFDITKFGATPGGDSTQGVLAAWKEACAATTASTIVIPKGIFTVRRLKLEGPCKAPITMQLQGTLKAPMDVTQLIKGEEWITILTVEGFTLNGGGSIDGQGADTWAKKKAKRIDFVQPTSLGLSYLTNAIIQDITTIDAKMFHINVLGGKNVTLERVSVIAPQDSPNTDGIHIGRSNGVTINECTIKTGDDCVSIGDGAQQITVTKVFCGPGHGIAIGSLGKYNNEEPVRGIFVRNCTLTSTTPGLRIKTWENSPIGEASDIHFDDITLTNVSNPILIDQEYCPAGNCPITEPPSRVKISKVSFKAIRGSSATKDTVKLICSRGVPCDGVEIGDINLTYNGPEGPANSTCSNVKPIFSGTQIPAVCSGETPFASAGAPLASAGAPLASAEAPLASAEAPLAPAAAPLAPAEAPKASGKAPLAPAEAPKASGKAPLAPVEAPKASGEAPLASAEAPLASAEAPTVSIEAPKMRSKTSKPIEAPKVRSKTSKASGKAPKAKAKPSKATPKAPKATPKAPKVAPKAPKVAPKVAPKASKACGGKAPKVIHNHQLKV